MSSMTASTAPIAHRSARGAQPPPRRLLGAAIVGGLGAIAFSVAVGGSVALAKSGMGGGSQLAVGGVSGEIPWLVLVAFIHVVVAMALVRGRDVVRVAATVVIGITAIAAAAAAAMTAAGIDPFSAASTTSHAAPATVGLLVIAAALYAAAAALAGIEPTED
jgi:hypothetical protein